MANSNEIKKKNSVVSDKRNTNLKWFSVMSAILLIAIVLVINILFDSILGDKLVFDLSATGQNAVSDVTVDYINSLPADAHIRIVGLFDKPSNIKDTPYEYIIPLLDNYAAKSGGRISVEYVNPQSYPAIRTELDPQGMFDLKEGLFAVAYNGRVITVNAYDCFTYDQSYLNTYNYMLPTSNIAENTFTNAIVNLTRGYQHKAYFVTGLREASHVQISNILAAFGCESVDLPASDTFAVPADCDLLIINGINSDISERMSQAMIDYINDGGKILVAVDFSGNNSTEQYLHLNTVLHEMNLHVDPYLLLENDTSYQLSTDPQSARVNSQVDVFSEYATFSTEPNLTISYARPVRSYDTPYSYIMVSPVLSTSAKATANLVDSEGHASQFANEGIYYVGYYSTFDGMAVPPEMYVFSSMTFTSDDYISQYGYNNRNVVFIRNVLRSLLKADDSTIVPAKALADYSINPNKVTKNSANALMVSLLIVVPAGLVITGVLVYSKRKNL